MFPSRSPNCSFLATTVSIAVPETTPNCPFNETAFASFHDDMWMPMPPWMILILFKSMTLLRNPNRDSNLPSITDCP